MSSYQLITEISPMLIGYARVSTQDQDPALQLDALARAGCERVFTETAVVPIETYRGG